MGGLTSAVHWWEESQMRVLVLGSLVVQFLLVIFTLLRRRVIPGWIRFVMWLAYLGGDAIAIYALATLFNRHKDHHDHDHDRRRGSRSMLEVMWAPILLLHLGGNDGITAYNIEDNELWSRHLLTAVSQVTVAIYVFWKSWPAGGDKRLLQASILLFIIGVFKCFTKPWALKRASITSLVDSPDAKRAAKQGEADDEMDPNSLDKYVKQAKAFVQEQKNKGNELAHSERACVQNGDPSPTQQAKQDKDEIDPFEEHVKRESDFVAGKQKDEVGAQGGSAHVEEDIKPTGGRTIGWILRGETLQLFVDLSSSDRGCRLSIFKYFWGLSQEKAETTTDTRKSKQEDKADTTYGYVRRGLANVFLLLYTKLKSLGVPMRSDSKARVITAATLLTTSRLSRLLLPVVAFGLLAHFRKSQREAYMDIDTKITFAILYCTYFLEGFSMLPLLAAKSNNNSLILRVAKLLAGTIRDQWPEMVAQYSLVGYLARNKNHDKLMWVATMLGCRDMVDRHWCMESYLSSRGITELVLQYVRDGWEKKIQDVASYRSFIDNRGHWALEGYEDELGWSIKESFDESVLLWHIATDFCFFSSPFSEHIRVCDFANKVPSTWQSLLKFLHLKVLIPTKTCASKKCGQRLAECKVVQCRQMSNYMVYLLFVNPEMLLPGTRRNLFTTAYDELNKLNPHSSCCCYCYCCCQKVEEKDLMKTLIETMQNKSKKQDPEIGFQEESKEGQPKRGCNGNFIDDAWDLAQGLLKLRDDSGEEKMWEVIQGVWVEMLCFSASRCRGYLHAKALGSGGEFLSYIWLLLFYMGMETFTERLQRERDELPSWEANNNAAQASDAYTSSGIASSSASKIHSRATPSSSHLDTGTSPSNYEIRIAMD